MADFMAPQFYVSDLGKFVCPDREQFLLDRYREEMRDSEERMLEHLISGMNPEQALQEQQKSANAAFRRWRQDQRELLNKAEEQRRLSEVKASRPNHEQTSTVAA